VYLELMLVRLHHEELELEGNANRAGTGARMSWIWRKTRILSRAGAGALE